MARSTVSPGKALEVQSRVAPFMSLDFRKETQLVKLEEDEKQASDHDADLIELGEDKMDEKEKEVEAAAEAENSNKQSKKANAFLTNAQINEVDSDHEDNQDADGEILQDEEAVVELTEAEKLALQEEEEDVFHILSEGEAADPIELTSKNMVDIGRVVAGGSFGALALTDAKPRFSTTKCITRCHLLVLNRNDWRKSEQDIVMPRNLD